MGLNGGGGCVSTGTGAGDSEVKKIQYTYKNGKI